MSVKVVVRRKVLDLTILVGSMDGKLPHMRCILQNPNKGEQRPFTEQVTGISKWGLSEKDQEKRKYEEH